MNKNLKNRPDSYKLSVLDYCDAVDKWFEGFEKELPEEIAYLKSMEPEELYNYIHDEKFEKEILGE